MPEKPFYTTLENRGQVIVTGSDRYSFTQGLITNDINLLKKQPLVYACLLTAQGKFLHDFFIREEADHLILDCEGGYRAKDLEKRLNLYKLRADVSLETHEAAAVYAIAGETTTGLIDPRHKALGQRSYTKPDFEERGLEDWDIIRIKNIVPDGSRDLIPEKSTMDEARMDQLQAIDYKKGCYIGQELTARMHYRGLGKKHLYVVKGNLPAHGEIINIDGKNAGEMRSKCGDIGLALLKDDIASAHSKNDIILIKSNT